MHGFEDIVPALECWAASFVLVLVIFFYFLLLDALV